METVKTVVKWLTKDWLKVQEDKALHQNRLFWLVIIAPLSFVAWISWRLTEELITKGLYNPHVNSESLASFVNYYAFPITLLTLPLTLAVMINRFHSSKQKAKSNRLVEQNNTANNFLNHYRYFKEHCETLEKRFNFQRLEISSEILYKRLFVKSSVSNFITHIDIKVIDELIIYINCKVEEFKKYEQEVGIDILTYSTGPNHDENMHEKGSLREVYLFRFNFNGIYFQKEIDEQQDFENMLRSKFDIIFMLLCFNGVSNFEKVGGEYTQKFWDLYNDNFENNTVDR